jgi:hypothetical protein
MGTVRIPPKVLFFLSIIFNDSGILSRVEEELTGTLGRIEERTHPVVFSHSDYYEREMGSELQRYLLLFSTLEDRERLIDIKHRTNEIEHTLAAHGKRTVNIDPGYIALEHVILATTKGFSHRPYLGKGIYADLTLMYENGTYRGFNWTYPDYKFDLIPLLNGWRDHYKRIQRCQKA